MTIYDVAMIGAMAAGVAWGFWRGITWQLASIFSLVLGYSASRTLSEQLAPHFPGEPVVARALAMIVIYAVVSGGVFLVAWIIRATLKKMKFEAFDRHLGMMLGAVEGTLLGLIVTLFVVSLAPQTRGPIFSSPTGKLVGSVMATLGPVLPGEARRVLAPFWEGAEEARSNADAESLAQADPAPVAAPAPAPAPTRATGPAVPAVQGQPAPDRDEAPQPARAGRPRLFGRKAAAAVSETLEAEAAAPARSLSEDVQSLRNQARDTAQSNLDAVNRSKAALSQTIEAEKGKLGRTLSNEIQGVRNQAREAVQSNLNAAERSKSAIGQMIEGEKSKLKESIISGVNGIGSEARDNARSKLNSVDPSLGELFSKGEQRVSRAIADKVEQELQKVGASPSNARATQNR